MPSTPKPCGVIDRFETLAPIDNPSGEEAVIREHILAALAVSGIRDTTVDAAGNLIARVPGKAHCPTVMLSAHMDSVPPCRGIRPVRDTFQDRPIIRSEGKTILGADDKAGIAVILEVIDQLTAGGFQENPPLELFFSVQEEVGLQGGKALDTSACQATMALVLDGEGRAGMIFNQGPTQTQLRAGITGKSSHAGISPEAGISAIEALALFCTLVPSGRPGGAYGPETTTNLGVVHGGEGLNVVPCGASVVADARTHTEDSARLIRAAWDQAGEAVSQRFAGVQVQLEFDQRYQGFRLSAGHPLIRLTEDAARDVALSPAVAPMNIGSDAHWLNLKGIPTVVLGMGFHQSHSLGEYLYVEELEQVVAWTMAVLARVTRED
ncbi:MAG: M20/M25/M40 family metallo-hydrolase [Candidatus Melainabacteria bacterium]